MNPADCGNFPTGLGESPQFSLFRARKRRQSGFVNIGTIFAEGLPTRGAGSTFFWQNRLFLGPIVWIQTGMPPEERHYRGFKQSDTELYGELWRLIEGNPLQATPA